MITIKDVAALAGVSPSTVSRVLSDSPRISQETKDRVRKALDELDYHPNAFARGLVTNTAGAIGILIPPDMPEFFVNPFFAELMSGISEVSRQQGFDIVLSTSGRSEADALDAMIRGRRVDGVLLLRSTKNDEALQKVIKHNFPAVLLGRPATDLPISYVNNDNVHASYVATDHFVRLGHRKIGFLGGSMEFTVTADRAEGYRNALHDAGIPLNPQMMGESMFVEQSGYMGMMRLLAMSDRPTAVVASDDVLAFGAMRAAAELGYRLPQDLAIIGFNDIRLSEMANPALTSVRVNMYELGASAAELLFEHIRGDGIEVIHRIIDTKLVVRASCGAQLSALPPKDNK